jgi:hypothetical protein
MQDDDALHPYNNCARNQTTSVIYYYVCVPHPSLVAHLIPLDGCIFLFFFLTGASLTYMTIENLPWLHLIGHGLRSGGHIWSQPAERPTSLLCPQRATAATCTNVTHQLLLAISQNKA